MSEQFSMDRRMLLTGLGGLAAGALLAPGRMEAGSLEPPGPPGPTMLSLSEIEPRTIVNEANTPGNAEAVFVISEPGSYYLAGNVTIPAGKIGILIDADDVTLDLNGYAMLGSAIPPSVGGIRCGDGGHRGITVKNGSIGRAGAFSVDLAHDGGRLSRVHDMVTKWSTVGIRVGSGSLAFDCAVLGAGNPGIDAGDESIVSRCRVAHHNVTPTPLVAINAGDSVILSECSTTGNFETGIEGGESLHAHDCAVDAYTALAMSAGAGALITNCMTGGCKGDGIRLDSDSLARGNRIWLVDVVEGVAGIRATGSRTVMTDNQIIISSANGKAMMDLEGSLNLVARNALSSNAQVPLLAVADNVWSIVEGAASAFTGDSGGVELPPDNPDANIRR